MNQLDQFLSREHTQNSFNNILQKFLISKRKKVTHHTVARLYYSLIRISKTTNNPPLNTITSKWLRTYTNELWNKYAPESVRTAVADIKQFFRWAKKKGYHTKNIAKRIKQPRQRKRRRKNRAISEDKNHQLMQHIINQLKTAVYRDVFGILQTNQTNWNYKQTKQLRDLFIITFLYETGARVGELANLSSNAIDRATQQPQPTYTITMNGKTADVDRSFTERTAELWRLWQKIRPETCPKPAVIGWGNGHKPAPLQANGISQMIYRRCQQANIRPFRANVLRHTKITRSRRLVGLETASRLVDHADIRTTKNYDHWQTDELSEATKKTGLQRDFWREA